jgi:UDP-N-acetylmuramoyl-tripeptide--D-alanyl-D-alanine ligase
MIEELYKIYQQYPSVQTDTRKLKAGDIFFALKGPNFQWQLICKESNRNGAACVVIDEKEYEIEGKTLLVPDVLSALQN